MISLKTWQKILASHPEANFLQSPEWAEVNQKIGHTVITKSFKGDAFVLAIVKDAKRGRYLEVPGGPLLDWTNAKEVEIVFDYLRQVAKDHKCVFIRFRPQLLNTPENLALLPADAKPASFHLHAEHTVMIDLTQSEDDLLKNMRRQTRYEVRRSLKKGLIVKKSNSKEIFELFHKIQAETAQRQNFIPPKLSDLLAYREAFGDNAQIYYAYISNKNVKTSEVNVFSENVPRETKLVSRERATREDGLASGFEEKSVHSDELAIVALGLIIKCNGEADYFEAASTDLNRKLPGAYALQWQVMKDLKKQGIKRYNLWGIAPKDQPHHRYAKVTTFKTGFGGEITEYIHAHDIIINKTKYLKAYLIETIRKKRRHLS